VSTQQPERSERASEAVAELERLRQEVLGLRTALGLQTALEELAESFDVLVGSVGPDRVGVPLRHVLEVIPRLLVTILPDAPAPLAGYMRWRGLHVPVLDMGRLWSGAPLPLRLEDRIVVVRRAPGELRGLLLSEVEGVTRVDKSALSAVRPHATGAPWALGFVQAAERPFLLASLDALLGPLAGTSVPASAGAVE
jgi:chemotaxis signal transduction protein